MTEFDIKFRAHAIQRMFERSVSEKDIHQSICEGEIIKEYPQDNPYPSKLILAWIDDRPLHVVVADDQEDGVKIVVTVYEPDPEIWTSDFKRRKQS